MAPIPHDASDMVHRVALAPVRGVTVKYKHADRLKTEQDLPHVRSWRTSPSHKPQSQARQVARSRRTLSRDRSMYRPSAGNLPYPLWPLLDDAHLGHTRSRARWPQHDVDVKVERGEHRKQPVG